MHKTAAAHQKMSENGTATPEQTRDVEHYRRSSTYTRNELTPRPSDDPNDPLNWPLWLKVFILIQVSILAALGGLNTAMINPAYKLLGKDLGVSTVTASYQTTVCIALNGIAPWLWIPLANKYGRRPIYLGTTLLGFASILGCAYVETWGQLLAARVFNGFFPVGFALGAGTVVDLFFFHQRGRAMGIFTVMVVNGSHLAPIFGGLLGQYCGWRWIFKFLAIFDAVMFIIIFFCLPETLYIRDQPNSIIYNGSIASDSPKNQPEVLYAPPPLQYTFKNYLYHLRLYSHYPQLNLRLNQFVLPSLKMARYPSVLFPALYYATMYGFASILPAVTVAAIFEKFFGWDTLVIGLAYGGSLTIGGCLGEACAGWVVDLIVRRERRKLGRDPEPEVRLRGIWAGEILVPAGLLIYGFTLQYHTVWIAPLIGMGVSCFGLQIITTTVYTYAIDCYRHESSEIAQLINFFRQEFGFTFAFYVVKLGDHIGYQFTFLFFALVGGILAFSLMLLVIWKGEEWRKSLGVPVGVNIFDSQLSAAEYHGDDHHIRPPGLREKPSEIA